MKLGELVGGGTEVVGPDVTLDAIAKSMIDSGTDCVAVVDDRRLIGVVTDKDVVWAVADGAEMEAETAREWMTETPDTFSPDVDVEEAATWLLEAGYRHLPVMKDGELLGVVGMRDVLWAIMEAD